MLKFRLNAKETEIKDLKWTVSQLERELKFVKIVNAPRMKSSNLPKLRDEIQEKMEFKAVE